MEDLKYDITKEYRDVVERVSQKFGYNADLKATLDRILPAMLYGANYEERQIYYQMLEHTPIILIPSDTKVSTKELTDRYIGNVNPHIIEEKTDEGEYGRVAPEGAFIVEPVIDENLNLIGRKQFLFVKAIDTSKKILSNSKERIERFGTGINVPHLIHELGHAWAGEVKTYRMEGNELIFSIGPLESRHSLSVMEDGKYSIKRTSREGLFIEEGLNTEAEIEAVARYLGITREEVEMIYKENPSISSNYHAWVAPMTAYLTEIASKKDINLWRIHKDKNAMGRINEKLSHSQRYQQRDVPTQEDIKLIQFVINPKTDVQKDIFERNISVFKKDRTSLTPLQLFENDLEKSFVISTNNFRFALEDYQDLIYNAVRPAYVMLNQTNEIYKNNQSKQEQK